jgi:hypothetical protein
MLVIVRTPPGDGPDDGGVIAQLAGLEKRGGFAVEIERGDVQTSATLPCLLRA